MPQRSVITIGNFDGVHVAHRAILGRARQLADAEGAAVLAITFDPHPASILRPGSEPRLLLDVDQRVHRLREAGADRVIVMPATAELLATEPQAFITALTAEHDAIACVEGPDFRFGRGRVGDVAMLHRLGDELGFAVHITPRMQAGLSDQLLAPVSSSLVRWLIEAGRVADAALCLGEPYDLRARVVRGDQRGRAIGVPTGNLAADEWAHRVCPADGVYAGYASVEGGLHPAAISVGVKPTFQGRTRVVEAHLLDFQADLYEKPLTVQFTRWLRDQQPFPSVDALRAQLQRDIDAVRRLATRGWLNTPVSAAKQRVYCETPAKCR